jgi:hypothetical protein
MNLRKLVIGSQLLFAREGTVIGVAPTTNTVSQAYKPDVEDAPPYVNWTSLGEVRDFLPTAKAEETDIIAPSPGAFRRTDSVVTSTTLDLAFALYNVSELFFESILLAGGPITANAYQPGVGTGKIRGWLKCQQYDQTDTLRNVFDVYISGAFKGEKQDNKLIVATLDCKVLYSALQSGNLTLGN